MDDLAGESSASVTSNNNNNRIWTNEKHLSFLNSLEATFVRTMLIENNYNSSSTGRRHRRHSYDHDLRLDRYLPDSLESTLDSASYRQRKSPAAAADMVGSRSKMGGTSDHQKRSRRFSLSLSRNNTRAQNSQNINSSHDQVVPQLTTRTKDKQTAVAD
ncbi:hypothetical protein LINPERPRIM_LOCUS12083 [Linum perenne]